MADQDTKSTGSKQSIQCTPDAKAKFKQVGEQLNWTAEAVSDLAAELLVQVVAGEPTPEQRKAQMLSKLSTTTVEHKSNNTPTRVAS